MNILIKRFVSACVLGVVAIGLVNSSYAALTKKLRINYSTTGTAQYADGSDILDGEWFVLVWTADGTTLDLSKDVSGDVNSFLGDNWCWLDKQASSGGKVDPAVNFNTNSTRFAKGAAQLYLLDTRISETELAPLGTCSDGRSFPTVVNSAVLIEGAKYTWTSWDTNPHPITGPAPATSAWVKTLLNPTPVIASFALADGVSTVGVTDTLSTHTYKLAKAYDVGFTNVIWRSAETNGAAFIKTSLEISDTDATNSAAFYRIEIVK